MAADFAPRIRVLSTPLGRFVALNLEDDGGPTFGDSWEEDVVDAEFTVVGADAPPAAHNVRDRLRARVTRQPPPRDEQRRILAAVLAEMQAQQRSAFDAAFEAWKTGLRLRDERESDPAQPLLPLSSDVY